MEHELSSGAPRGASWLATAALYYAEKARDAVQFICEQFEERPPLHSGSTPQEVIAYANSIRHREPGFAADLIAAAGRAEDGQ